ncbi:hypothetical protein EU244_028915 [Rhodococcus qingshengii]|uniref:hypothetical protein n=1 Tax=Rhodococcus qingshengii TaxID=334542 RepID=UPI0010A674CB|nr:hypothetical protein [Rhodococcus qingshengii]THJ67182.1 hypothetical protein EU244_26895 [Rhodococcus qingshengii]
MSKKTVVKLMREFGLQYPTRRRKRYKSFRDEVGGATDNVRNEPERRQGAAPCSKHSVNCWPTELAVAEVIELGIVVGIPYGLIGLTCPLTTRRNT